MRTKLLLILFVSLLLSSGELLAQAEATKATQEQIEKETERITAEEKEALKTEVIKIERMLEEGKITAEIATELKREAAEKHARNIEDRVAIIERKASFEERNDEAYNDGWITKSISIGGDKERVYDRRTYSDLVLAVGFNNAIGDGQSLDNSPYKIGGSRFLELGIAWKTRVFENTNFMRIKYGFSFQFNGLKPVDNQYFVTDGQQTILEEYPVNLDKSKFRMDNLVLPVHFEFGTSTKKETEDYIRYNSSGHFKVGVGGYAGFNLLTIQKLKYEMDGNEQKERIKSSYNTNNFIYGLSGYLAFGDVAVYVKYDLNPIFKNNPIEEHNLSVGLRFDMD